jgi:hypothetical protein
VLALAAPLRITVAPLPFAAGLRVPETVAVLLALLPDVVFSLGPVDRPQPLKARQQTKETTKPNLTLRMPDLGLVKQRKGMGESLSLHKSIVPTPRQE